MSDLTLLPAPVVIETLDYEAILQALKDDLKSRLIELGMEWGVDVLESDPGVVLMETFAYRELLLRSRINFAARANLLAFAKGSDLDHLVAWLGVTRLDGETDERLRLRYQLATFGRSAGGPEERYVSVALGASINVRDVAVWREGRDPTVRVAVLSEVGDGSATPALLAAVATALNDPAVKVVSDRFEVVSAVRVVQDVSIKIRLDPTQPDTLADAVRAKILTDWINVDRLGFDLTKSWLIATAMVPGVTSVEVVSPAQDVVASPNEAIGLGDVVVEISGYGR